MKAKQEEHDTLDLSERLRLLMVTHSLSVSDLARAARVSKSAMEKYLAGPSSPRAISIVALCRELGVDSEWLLFGKSDEEIYNIRRSVTYVVGKLIESLKRDGHVRDQFDRLTVGTDEFDMWSFEISDRCGLEVGAFFVADRKRALLDAASDLRIAQL
jgi:transcriptional regulator with XRE-family HTH domain